MKEPREPSHKRLSDFEAFDRIELVQVPRFKTSGVSGDEWRTSIHAHFFFKGARVFDTSYRDMSAALIGLGAAWLGAQEPISDAVIDREKLACDQPGCPNPAELKYYVIKLYSDRGEELRPEEQRSRYRQFCKGHKTRGDASFEDSDKNYLLSATVPLRVDREAWERTDLFGMPKSGPAGDGGGAREKQVRAMLQATSKPLIAAIRRFTVDMPNDQPNGEAERHLAALSEALHARNLRKAIEAFVSYTNATADDTKALRIAADAHFGGDFKKPEELSP